ncbi:MAG: hypothetical protein HS113_18870 [Verrucomicrobiales bacterium]|nr:hypothetical protein [Verrucomicrobiales bacterium]
MIATAFAPAGRPCGVLAALLLLAGTLTCAGVPTDVENQAAVATQAFDIVARQRATLTAPPIAIPTRKVPDGSLLGNGDVGVAIGGVIELSVKGDPADTNPFQPTDLVGVDVSLWPVAGNESETATGNLPEGCWAVRRSQSNTNTLALAAEQPVQVAATLDRFAFALESRSPSPHDTTLFIEGLPPGPYTATAGAFVRAFQAAENRVARIALPVQPGHPNPFASGSRTRMAVRAAGT